MFTVFLLGDPYIERDGQSIALSRRKSRALVYYLASAAQPVRREELLGLLWVDLPRPSALQTLRTTLHGLKQALGDDLLLDGDRLSLPNAWVDRRVFEVGLNAAATPDGLRAALDLYRGDFLQGFDVPDSQAFDDWASIERERLRRLVIAAWTRLAEWEESAGQFRRALEAVESALAFNPLQEDLQREAIRLLFLSGDRPGAIQRYDALRRLLDNEMGVPPMAETRKLYDAIIRDEALPTRTTDAPARPRAAALRAGASGAPNAAAAPAAPATGAARPAGLELPFVGRADEQRRLGEMLRPGSLTLIEGEPGIGKTRLAHEYLHSFPGPVVEGRGRELESGLPYHPIAQAMRQLFVRPPDGPLRWRALQSSVLPVWLAEAARIVPELESSPALERLADEPRLWEGLRQVWLAAAQQPLALLLDDLHWADAATVGWLGYLARAAEGSRLHLLATTRPPLPRSPLSALLQGLARENRLERLELPRLDEVAVRRAVQSLPPASAPPPPNLADWLWRASEGNPYILTEMARYWQAGGNLSETPPVPHSVAGLVQSRLRSLSDAAQRLLDAAVAAGREFDLDVAARAAGLSETAAYDALEELQALGLVLSLDDGRLAFDHPATMEVAYHMVGEARHRLLHRRVAEAIEQLHPQRSPELSGQLAWHYAEGSAFELARPHAQAAARHAERLAAWNDAVRYYELALKGSAGPARLPVWAALADAHSKAGRFSQAGDVLRQALNWLDEHPDEAWREKLTLALARVLLPQARYAEAADLAHTICTDARTAGLAAAELVQGVALSLEGLDLAQAARHLQTAEEVWRSLPPEQADHSILTQIHFERGSVAAQQGDLAGAVALYRQALDDTLLEGGAQPLDYRLDMRILALNNLAYHLHLLSDATAEGYARQALEMAQDKGVLGLQPYLRSTLGEICLSQRRLDEAAGHFQEGLALAERFHIPERVAGLTANLGRLAATRGETARAIHLLSSALGQAETSGAHTLAKRIRQWMRDEAGFAV